MPKEKKVKMISARYTEEDIEKWKEAAKILTRGNLSLFLEMAANKLSNQTIKSK